MKLPSPQWTPSQAQPAFSSALAALLVASSTLNPMPSYAATDGAAIGKCVVSKCTAPLARCVATSPTCLANLLCINTCTNRPDESECQIKCGDDFTDAAVEAFTKCAVSDKQVREPPRPSNASATGARVHRTLSSLLLTVASRGVLQCVPQRQDDGAWPVPKNEALVAKFSPEQLTGPWYISAGLNKAFDTFDCQLHRCASRAARHPTGRANTHTSRTSSASATRRAIARNRLHRRYPLHTATSPRPTHRVDV